MSVTKHDESQHVEALDYDEEPRKMSIQEAVGRTA